MNRIWRQGGLEVKQGNFKIGRDTLILNMGSAVRCPSRKRGFCKLGNKCYALKAEKLHTNHVPAYRNRQEKYWRGHGAVDIECDFMKLLETRKHKKKPLHRSIKYLRVNESGDFWSQACVQKLNHLAHYLWEQYGIKTYTYTARKDLDFNGVHFNIKGSSFMAPHGMTITRPKAWLEAQGDLKTGFYLEAMTLYKVCPMDCRKCKVCLDQTSNVVFPLH